MERPRWGELHKAWNKKMGIMETADRKIQVGDSLERRWYLFQDVIRIKTWM